MTTGNQTTTTHEPEVAVIASWICIVASFVLSFITWVALGDIAGYGLLRFVMPLVVDSYIVCCIVTWLSPVSERVAKFAFWNMYISAGIGVVAQSAYHCASVWESGHVAWKALLALLLGAIPPAFAFAGVHIRGMSRRDKLTAQTSQTPESRMSVPSERTATPPPLPKTPIVESPAQTYPRIENAPRDPVFTQSMPAPIEKAPSTLATPPPPPPQKQIPAQPTRSSLTPYQSNKLARAAQLYGAGHSPKQVAKKMDVSLRTAQRYQAQLSNGAEVSP